MVRVMSKEINVGKLTKQRKIIIDILNGKKEPFTINEIIDIAEKEHNIKLVFSTIFRNLESLCKSGVVRKTSTTIGDTVYTVNENVNEVHHSHILKCKKCNKEIVIDICPFVLLQDSIEKETGFRVDTEVSKKIEGYCDKCKRF